MEKKQSARDLSKCKIVFVVGPPGCGKSTQARKLAADFGYVHISLAELLSPGSKTVRNAPNWHRRPNRPTRLHSPSQMSLLPTFSVARCFVMSPRNT